jgi:methyltransferase (TIGR00027 family)
VFEVDHPATQGKKRDMLEQAGIPLPVDLVFAPIDFEKSTVNEALREAGMDFSKPAFFSWLGVTMYLTRDALEGTFRMVGSMPAQSEIVFDYMIDPSLAPPAAHPVIEAIMRRAEDAGEPWRSFFHPQTLRADLTGWGFTTFEDLGREEINTRYFSGRTDDLRGGGLARFMSAVV